MVCIYGIYALVLVVIPLAIESRRDKRYSAAIERAFGSVGFEFNTSGVRDARSSLSFGGIAAGSNVEFRLGSLAIRRKPVPKLWIYVLLPASRRSNRHDFWHKAIAIAEAPTNLQSSWRLTRSPRDLSPNLVQRSDALAKIDPTLGSDWNLWGPQEDHGSGLPSLTAWLRNARTWDALQAAEISPTHKKYVASSPPSDRTFMELRQVLAREGFL